MSNTHVTDVTDDKQCEWLHCRLGKFAHHDESAEAGFPISRVGKFIAGVMVIVFFLNHFVVVGQGRGRGFELQDTHSIIHALGKIRQEFLRGPCWCLES
jgi:hypothetical protein